MQDHCFLAVLFYVFALQQKSVHGIDEPEECRNMNDLSVLNRCCIVPSGVQLSEERRVLAQMCEKTIYGDRQIFSSEVKPEAKCKSGSFQFVNCLGRSLFLNCPEESWKGADEECVKTRGIFQQCINKDT